MSFDERDKIILIIICSVISFVFIIIIISFIIWLIIHQYRSKNQDKQSIDRHPPSPIPTYHRTQKIPPVSNIHHIKGKKRRRFNTNESTITLSFDPPHLINQNVKNLQKLLNNESTLTASSWHYEETFPKRYCCHQNLSSEPVYASSSTVLTSVSNLALPSTRPSHPNIHFLSELDHVLRSKQNERPKPSLKHSQSCRQPTDLLPFDYYRANTSPSTITGTNSSSRNSLEPTHDSTRKYPNTTLARKARLGQLRDDTAILY
ncbi:unnamed protein product [Adineta ricciae]|uniref:Uncharacterized protein n=1 Tax=Adineta ricciae TaxID=249248 RepID=A0A815J349_ADIRI|nr:unnamed protein product [Adineta ricciae]CAF1374942.1 unnamed protein product [Adineta ricciae]